MTRSKRIFVFSAVLFFMALGYISYDIGTRTTFPGSKPQLKERIQNYYHAPGDSVDSAQEATKATHR